MRLLGGSAKILDIALDCGFGDVSNFNRAFRTEFGVNPRQWRSGNSPRGAVFSGGTGFQVSALDDAATPADESRFGTLNANYPAQFQTFSPNKLFTVLGSTSFDVNFFVAGSNTPATVSAFGAVFADVDLLNTSSIEFFDAQNNSLGLFFSPAQNNGRRF